MKTNTLNLRITLELPMQQAWDAIVDWQAQSDWMLQTTVWSENYEGKPERTKIFAFTGPFHKIYPRFSWLGILDEMHITHWQPPQRCDVIHVGKIIKGTGTFQLSARSESRSDFFWSETIQAPRWIFILIRPFFVTGVWISLRRLAAQLKK